MGSQHADYLDCPLNFSGQTINQLIASRAYAKKPPHPKTAAERQGREGVLIGKAQLRKEGYTTVLVNQDRNNNEKHRPDALAYHPEYGWKQIEFHNYYYRQTISDKTAAEKNDKDWLPNLPRRLVYIFPVKLTETYQQKLAKEAVELINGLFERVKQGVCSTLSRPYSRLSTLVTNANVRYVGDLGRIKELLSDWPDNGDSSNGWRWVGRHAVSNGVQFGEFSMGQWYLSDGEGHIL
jgi:hypothetical protein